MDARQHPSHPAPAPGGEAWTSAGPAGRDRVIDDDPLIAMAARLAACSEQPAGDGGARYVGVHGLERVAFCPLRQEPWHGATVLYTLRDHLGARLHALHGCADAYAVLLVGPGEGAAALTARFEPVCGPDRLTAAGLTVREAGVLALVLARLSDAEIAARLVVSPATVRAHCRSILRKLGARSRRDLRESLLPPAADQGLMNTGMPTCT